MESLHVADLSYHRKRKRTKSIKIKARKVDKLIDHSSKEWNEGRKLVPGFCGWPVKRQE